MRKILKWFAIGVGIVAALVVGLLAYSTVSVKQVLAKSHTPPSLQIDEIVASSDASLGERIVRVRNGCVDCHGEDLAGKIFLDDPAIGKMAGPNITPYKLGGWSNEEIARAIRFGLNRELKPLVFMPSHEYNSLSEKDLGALIAYLRSVPAVEKESEPLQIGPMAKILFTLGKFPLMAPTLLIDLNAPFSQKPEETPTREFGEYLVKSACIGCHGPQLAGGPIPGAPPEWPPAADIRLAGDSVWSEESFFRAMKEGISPVTQQAIRPPMPLALTKQMTETELKAIWSYLSTLN